MDWLGAACLDIFEESHRLVSKVAFKPFIHLLVAALTAVSLPMQIMPELGGVLPFCLRAI